MANPPRAFGAPEKGVVEGEGAAEGGLGAADEADAFAVAEPGPVGWRMAAAEGGAGEDEGAGTEEEAGGRGVFWR